MDSLGVIVLLFFIYAFLGQILEFMYILITERRRHLTGFLSMPVIPIYGFGAILISFLVLPYVDNPFFVFVLSMVIATVLEYFTHLLLDKVFRVQLWDYSHMKFNFQGRISLVNTLGFGIAALLLVYVLHPFFTGVLSHLPAIAINILAIILISILFIDFANSLASVLRIRFGSVHGSLDEVRKQIEVQLAETAKGLRRGFLRLHDLNVRRLKFAFPQAVIRQRRNKK